MPKFHSQYICQQCGYAQVGWSGKCPNCGEWNSLVETVTETPQTRKHPNTQTSSNSKPQVLSDIKLSKNHRVSTNIEELDRVLGGGIVPGQVILLAGEPGIGKSTILLQLADNLKNVLYVSGEESSQQIAIRAGRLGIKKSKINILEETDVDNILNVVSSNQSPTTMIVIDSIQTMTTSDLSGLAGSVGQVRECSARLVRLAKSTNTPIFIVGHVTKEKTVAGPSTLAHIVDTVLWFEGDKNTNLRLIRSYKNRFGATDEVGIFEMGNTGLVSITNPQKIFLTNTKNVPGSAITSILEGTRPMLVEIQSLTVATKQPYPKRIAQGFDQRRLEMLIAILIKRAHLPLWDQDIFLNVTGGITIKDPSADLAICLCIVSSFKELILPAKTVAIGEVGLLGEIRVVANEEKRIKESMRLGYKIISSNPKNQYLSQVVHNFLAPNKNSER